MPVAHFRQPGIGMHQHRRCGTRSADLPDDLDHAFEPIAAVRPDDVRAGLGESGSHVGRRDTHHGPVLAGHCPVKRKRTNHFKAGVLPRSFYSTDRLVDRRKRFNAAGVRPSLLQGKVLRGGMGTGMPMWGAIFTDQQTWNIIAYLYTFQFDYKQ